MGLGEDSPLPRGLFCCEDGLYEPSLNLSSTDLTLSWIHCPSQAVSLQGPNFPSLLLMVSGLKPPLLNFRGCFLVWVFQNVMDRLGLLERIQWVKEGRAWGPGPVRVTDPYNQSSGSRMQLGWGDVSRCGRGPHFGWLLFSPRTRNQSHPPKVREWKRRQEYEGTAELETMNLLTVGRNLWASLLSPVLFSYPGAGWDKTETTEDGKTQLGSNCKSRTEMRDWNF